MCKGGEAICALSISQFLQSQHPNNWGFLKGWHVESSDALAVLQFFVAKLRIFDLPNPYNNH